MSLYERILQEAQLEGLEYRPPQTSSSRRELTGERGMLKMWTLHLPSDYWTAMAFRSLQRKHPLGHGRLLVERNSGDEC